MKQKSNIRTLVRRRSTIAALIITLLACMIQQAVVAGPIIVSIPSNQPWTDTGIDLVAGQTLVLNTDPNERVAFGFGGTFGTRTITSDGIGDEGVGGGLDGTAFGGTHVPSAVILTLVGKVGGSTAIGTGTLLPEGQPGKGEGFVGSSYNQEVLTTGRLYLGFNDDNFTDNSGAFTVAVEVIDINQGGLIAHYPLDGNAYDVVGGRNGTMVSPATFSSDVPMGIGSSQSLALDGIEAKVIYDVLPGDTVSGTFTVALWVNPAEKASQNRAFGFFGTRGPMDHSFDAKFRVDNRIRTDLGTGASWLTIYDTPPNLLDFTVNTWFHIAIVVTPGSQIIYVDGNVFASSAFGTTPALLWDENHDIGIGGVGAGPGDGEAFHGLIDDVRIYDIALSQSDIQNLLSSPNADPVCDLGPDITTECAGELTSVQLNGSLSYDPDGDSLAFEWTVAAESGAQLDDPSSPTPVGLFPVGPTLVTLTLTDGKGGLGVCDLLVTVEDTAAPVVVCTTDVSTLWPPDHKIRTVSIFLGVSDVCTAPQDMIVLCTVSSSEPDNDPTGDGNTIGDTDGFDGFTAPVPVNLTFIPELGGFEGAVELRAERDGDQAGRTYSIVCHVEDESGNMSSASCVVVVPQNRKRN